MSDEFLVEVRFAPPLEGVYEGLDPTLDDSLFPPTRAANLQNVRCSDGRWTTRHGSGLELNIDSPNSGETRLFTTLYEADGSRFRLLARGADNAAKLYDLEVGVDSAWQAVSGGTGLGTTTTTQPYFHSCSLGEAEYITDRSGTLKKYLPATGLSAVTIPTAPSVAPRTKAWTYGILDAFTGAGTMGWTESDSGSFDIATGTSDVTPPVGTGVAKITLTGGGTRGDTISKDESGETINSHTIAFYFMVRSGDSIRKITQLGVGLQKADEFAYPIQAPRSNEWFAHFWDVGYLSTINYKRFKVLIGLTDEVYYFSELFLPGRLEGYYRWAYTHYNPTTGHESGLSPISNSGEALDFTAVGRALEDTAATAAAFKKSCMLDFTSDSGSDAATTKIRVYRSGGVPELTVDPATGRSVWYRVAEIADLSNQLNGGHSAADTTLDVDSGTGFAADQWIVIAKGGATEEYQLITGVASNTLTVTPGLINAQSDNATVQVAYLDNVSNEAIDVTTEIDEERDSPPSGIHWIQRAPDGRLWAFRYAGTPTGIRVSNRATPLKPNDYECFPEDVDPQTRAHPLQGFGFQIGGDTTGEEIIWGGFFRGLPHVLTRNKLFRINAVSQTEWGANAIQKMIDVGCIAGETVQQHEGYLYWVSEGPRVVRWDGEGPVEVLSAQRVNVRLELAMRTAGTANSIFWFARCHENVFGKYYTVWFDHSSTELGCVQQIDYNISQNAWEPVKHFDGNGLTKAWNAADVWDGGSDDNELIAIDYRGRLQAMDVSALTTDSGEPIRISITTKKQPLGYCCELREIYLRLAGVSDTVTVTPTLGGTDYGDTTASYSVSLAGSGDTEVRIPCERHLKGKWLQIAVTGSVSSGPSIREIVAFVRPIRERKTTTDA